MITVEAGLSLGLPPGRHPEPVEEPVDRSLASAAPLRSTPTPWVRTDRTPCGTPTACVERASTSFSELGRSRTDLQELHFRRSVRLCQMTTFWYCSRSMS